MKIRAHSEGHIVELDDGTSWQVFPGDIDITLHWKPETVLKLVQIDDHVSSQALMSEDDEGRVMHTFPETWIASSAPRCDQNATGCALLPKG
jgi:hypothetical protein